MIKYSINECGLNGKKKFCARVNHFQFFDEKDVIKHILNLNTTLNQGEVYATLVDTMRVIKDMLIGGNKVKLFDKFIFSTSISGCFDTQESLFDESKHSVNVLVKPTGSFQKEFSLLKSVQKLSGKSRAPFISTIIDLSTNQLNERLTKGKNIRIKGNNLFFDASQPDEGIFLTDINGSELIKLEIDEKPSDKNIKILIPDNISIPADNKIYVEVRSRLGTKDLRKGRCKNPLVIA